mgnify:CR=1 FL=1
MRVERARSPNHAIELMAASDSFVLVGGGQAIVPRLRGGSVSAMLAIDVSDVQADPPADARGTFYSDACSTLSDLSAHASGSQLRAVREAIASIDPVTCNRATLGGAVVEGHLAPDIAVALLAVGAHVHYLSVLEKKGGRITELEEWSHLRPDPYLVLGISIPLVEGWHSSHGKHIMRGEGRTSISVAVGGLIRDRMLVKGKAHVAGLAPGSIQHFVIPRVNFEALESESSQQLAPFGLRGSVARSLIRRVVRTLLIR